MTEKPVRTLGEREVPCVMLDPQGTWPYWAGLIVERPTGIAYANKCDGLNQDVRMVEGYYLPLGRWLPEEGRYLDFHFLTAIFHFGRRCYFHGRQLPSERVEQLRRAVATVPFWAESSQDAGLGLDLLRLAEACEAWVPVDSPRGPGILVWGNCS